MAVDTYGAHGEPQFSDDGAPDTAVDPTQVGKYARLVGNRIVGTIAQRESFTHPLWPGLTTPWEGLQWKDTDGDKRTWDWSGGWVSVPKMWGTLFSTNANVDGLITINHSLGMVPQYAVVSTLKAATDALDKIADAVFWDDPAWTSTQIRIRMRREDTNNWFPSDFFRGFVIVGKN